MSIDLLFVFKLIFFFCFFVCFCFFLVQTIAKLERDKARFDRRLQQELSDRDAYFETLQRQLQTIAKVRVLSTC
jgi:cbb3-type cytochrome oxidase subunit 3